MMSTAPKHDRISIQDDLAGETLSDQRHEYVAGIVYAQGGGSNRHNAVATNVIVALANQLRGRPCRAFNSDTKVRIRNARETRFKGFQRSIVRGMDQTIELQQLSRRLPLREFYDDVQLDESDASDQ
ncbi:Uma2 family endonuclease [Rhodopirellula sp. JC639]|uniref:Uma2 family endonuclease n=1 Tax=Stieleria mannarensis TaxID=2755585 RepID=UPI001602AB7F|nr:Uma2 family endonuclease [Rhodopirellula sp. JC639]